MAEGAREELCFLRKACGVYTAEGGAGNTDTKTDADAETMLSGHMLRASFQPRLFTTAATELILPSM